MKNVLNLTGDFLPVTLLGYNKPGKFSNRFRKDEGIHTHKTLPPVEGPG